MQIHPRFKNGGFSARSGKGENLKISNDEKIALLKKMILIRLFEEKTESLFYEKHIPGFVHLSIGQEA